MIVENIIRCYGKRVTVFAVAIAAGDIMKYQLFVYGSFVWEIHVRYNKQNYMYSIKSLNNFQNISTSFSHIKVVLFCILQGFCYVPKCHWPTGPPSLKIYWPSKFSTGPTIFQYQGRLGCECTDVLSPPSLSPLYSK